MCAAYGLDPVGLGADLLDEAICGRIIEYACRSDVSTKARAESMITDEVAAERGDMSALHLAETLATRLCHDMAGMLGALAGALELAAADPAQAGESLAFADDAAAMLSLRLRLLRAAWGPDGEAQTGGELRGLLAGIALGRRVRLVMDGVPAHRHFSAAASRLLLNLAMLGVEAVGGDGEVELIEACPGEIVVTISGPRAAWPSGFAEVLHDAAAARQAAVKAEPRALQALMTALIAHESKQQLTLLFAAAAEAAAPLCAKLA